jgi:hypothetical protein
VHRIAHCLTYDSPRNRIKQLWCLVMALLALLSLIASCGPAVPLPTLTPLPVATQTPRGAATAIPASTPTLAPTGTQTRTSTPPAAIDLAPFKKLAGAGGCSDIRNRLFLIDGRLVFWDIAGNCADASYSQMLYGSTPDQVLCVWHDSIAGPVKNCRDERYRDMFNVITANLDKPDLGLGPQHTVQPVPH